MKRVVKPISKHYRKAMLKARLLKSKAKGKKLRDLGNLKNHARLLKNKSKSLILKPSSLRDFDYIKDCVVRSVKKSNRGVLKTPTQRAHEFFDYT